MGIKLTELYPPEKTYNRYLGFNICTDRSTMERELKGISEKEIILIPENHGAPIKLFKKT